MWFFIALTAPFLWAVSNHIDKYLIEKFFKEKGIGALLLFSSFVGLFILPFIFIVEPNIFRIETKNAFIIFLSGILYIISLVPYLYALDKDETSVVVPVFQTIPVFGYILGFIFLGEKLTVVQVTGSLLIIAAAIFISFDFDSEKIKFKKKIFLLMFLSSLLLAINSFLFKFVAIRENFWKTVFWEDMGFSFMAIFLFVFVRSYRK